MLTLVLFLAAIVLWLAVVVLMQRSARKSEVATLRQMCSRLRHQRDQKDAERIQALSDKERGDRLHTTLGQEHAQLVREHEQLCKTYDETYDAWLALDQGRAELEDFARQAAEQAAQATVEIHEAELVDNVPLPAWDAQTSVHRVPVGPDPESPTDWWDRAALNARIDAEQMALAGGAA